MILRSTKTLLIVALFSSAQLWAYPGTTGTPLGGIGTGYVKFDAKRGVIAASDRLPPGAGSMTSEFSNRQSSSSGFYFYAGGTPVEKAKTDKEDAKCPIYTAEFENVKDVEFKLKAFGPVVPGDDAEGLNIKLATSPAAMFEITAKNTGSSAIDVAVALEFVNQSKSVKGLLGGQNTGKVDSKKGITFENAEFNDLSSENTAKNTGNAYMLVDCSADGAEFSSGAKGDFLTNGVLSNSDGNFVGAKCNIEPGNSVKFKFVLSWWRTFVSSQDRYGAGKPNEDNFYYHNNYGNSKEVAEFCMEKFDYVRNAIVNMVDRTMASNFPEWYKDRLFNNTYPLIHNSLWTKDGRAAYWEGKYGIIGTIDQGQHAAIWYAHNWPKNQWAELAYWLRDAIQGNTVGQIHHDFNTAPANGFKPPEARFITQWDHWDRPDYWWQSNTTEWSDLNSMAIFKAYELTMVTAEKDSLKKYFDLLKITANRIVEMSKEANASIPLKSKSTYDSDGEFLTPQYACGVAVTAYKAMEKMAKFLGDSEAEKKYSEIYTTARKEYKDNLFKSDYGNITKNGWAEGHVGGYAWANYFGFDPIQDKEFIEAGCDRAFKIYSDYSDIKQKVGGWHYYTYDHLGGALTAIGKPDNAMKIHEWDHKLSYQTYPDLIFWQELFSEYVGPNNYVSYMTGPNIWRSYFQFMGYLFDKAHNSLYVRPNLPKEMENKIINAALPNPYGWGTLSYDGNSNAESKRTQSISISYDKPVTIKEVILKNNTNGTTPFVFISDNTKKLENFTVKTEELDADKNIRITFNDAISVGPEGLEIQVYSENVGIRGGRSTLAKEALAINSSILSIGKAVHLHVAQPGLVTVDLLALNGSKIGTLMSKYVDKAGACSFNWNGKTVNGTAISSLTGILRVKSNGEAVSRLVHSVNR